MKTMMIATMFLAALGLVGCEFSTRLKNVEALASQSAKVSEDAQTTAAAARAAADSAKAEATAAKVKAAEAQDLAESANNNAANALYNAATATTAAANATAAADSAKATADTAKAKADKALAQVLALGDQTGKAVRDLAALQARLRGTDESLEKTRAGLYYTVVETSLHEEEAMAIVGTMGGKPKSVAQAEAEMAHDVAKRKSALATKPPAAATTTAAK